MHAKSSNMRSYTEPVVSTQHFIENPHNLGSQNGLVHKPVSITTSSSSPSSSSSSSSKPRRFPSSEHKSEYNFQRATQTQSHQYQHPTYGTVNPVQVQNYITWVNTHLKKRPGVKLIENLQTDMRDGVCLIHLIEIISGHVLTDVNLSPKTPFDFKDNIEKVLKFMHVNSIKMHQITSREIVEGILKPTMRLILALAAHFKPTNVQQYSSMKAANGGGAVEKVAQSPHRAAVKSPPSAANSSKINNRVVVGSNCVSASTRCNNGGVIGADGTKNVKTSTSVTSSGGLVLTSSVSSSTSSSESKGASSNKQVTTHQHQHYHATSHGGRKSDSMTHLVQKACVSLADVRRFNQNQNFHITYIKRNNLGTNSPPPQPSQHHNDSDYHQQNQHDYIMSSRGSVLSSPQSTNVESSSVKHSTSPAAPPNLAINTLHQTKVKEEPIINPCKNHHNESLKIKIEQDAEKSDADSTAAPPISSNTNTSNEKEKAPNEANEDLLNLFANFDDDCPWTSRVSSQFYSNSSVSS